MVKIVSMSQQPGSKNRFVKFGWEMQRSIKNAIPFFIDDEEDLLNEHKNFFFDNGGLFHGFLALDQKDRVVGRIGAMVNTLIENEDNLGLIGLFQVQTDYQVAKTLLDHAIDWLKSQGCIKVWGPVDFSIWHRHRFAVDSFESKPFIGEPRNPPFYPLYFERYGFVGKFHWKSILMDKKFMVEYLAKHQWQLEMFEKAGYQGIFYNPKNQREMMHLLYDMICSSYKNFPAFSKIPKKHFINKFHYVASLIDRECTRFIKNPSGKFVGFILVLKDLADALRAMRGRKNLIAKFRFKWTKKSSEIANLYQGGVVPGAIREAIILGRKAGGKGISLNHVAHCWVFNSILSTGNYEYALGTLRRSETAIQNHAVGDIKSTRNYLLYELNLSS